MCLYVCSMFVNSAFEWNHNGTDRKLVGLSVFSELVYLPSTCVRLPLETKNVTLNKTMRASTFVIFSSNENCQSSAMNNTHKAKLWTIMNVLWNEINHFTRILQNFHRHDKILTVSLITAWRLAPSLISHYSIEIWRTYSFEIMLCLWTGQFLIKNMKLEVWWHTDGWRVNGAI